MIITKFKDISGHKDCIYALAKGNNEGVFFTASGDGWVIQWDINKNDKEGKLIAKLPASVYALYYDKVQNILLAGHRIGGIHVLDLSSKTEVRLIKHHTSIFDIKKADSNGKIMAACGKGFLLPLSGDKFDPADMKKVSEDDIRVLAPHPASEIFAAGSSDNKIRIFDVKSMKELHSFDAHNNSVFSLKYIQNGNWLVSGGRDARLRIWDVNKNYELFLDIPAHRFTINCIELSPDGKWLATASRDKTIRIWNTSNWQLIKTIDKERLSGHTHSVNKLLWTGHENLLVSAGDDKSVKVWKLMS